MALISIDKDNEISTYLHNDIMILSTFGHKFLLLTFEFHSKGLMYMPIEIIIVFSYIHEITFLLLTNVGFYF